MLSVICDQCGPNILQVGLPYLCSECGGVFRLGEVIQFDPDLIDSNQPGLMEILENIWIICMS